MSLHASLTSVDVYLLALLVLSLPCRDNVPRLQDFSQRFTSRFCELMHDVEEEVGAAGLHLLALLVEHGVVRHQVIRFVCVGGGGEVFAPLQKRCGIATWWT